MAKQDDYTRYTVRIPGPLYERVAAAADAGQRSVNAEIVATLEEKYPPPPPSAEWLIKVLEERGLTLDTITADDIGDVRVAISKMLDEFEQMLRVSGSGEASG